MTPPFVRSSMNVSSPCRTCIHQIVLEDSGHFPMLDESARFNRLMTDFLALISGDSPRELLLKEEWKRRSANFTWQVGLSSDARMPFDSSLDRVFSGTLIGTPV